MKAFVRHSGIAVPMLIDNVDTDQIIPSREMKRVSKAGLGEGLFAGWRYRYDGMQKVGLIDDFVLNQPRFAQASIILGGKNWGCGSSREHAVWALYDFGIRVIIAQSFGRIFHRNCARNGLLAIDLPQAQIDFIDQQCSANPQENKLIVDLEGGEIVLPGGRTFSFDVPKSDRKMLINGLDYIEYTLRHEEAIDSFVANDKLRRRWAYIE